MGPLKTIDEHYRDLADRAEQQCAELGNQMTAIIDEADDDGEPYAEKLCGIGRDKDGRAQLVFADPDGSTNRRTILYVDSIIELAKLLMRERNIA